MRPALRTPSSTEAWNDMNGMSPTTIARSTPRATAFTWCSISSIVTGYEIMVILRADADESVVGTVVDRITKVVGSGGGEVGDINRWGRRRFAYEIDDQTEGYYVVIKFTAEPETQPELERVLNLAD